jgi:hypothetical protein
MINEKVIATGRDSGIESGGSLGLIIKSIPQDGYYDVKVRWENGVTDYYTLRPGSTLSVKLFNSPKLEWE